jgi:hypothetical protein
MKRHRNEIADMAEPTSMAAFFAFFKTVGEAVGALWERGAILLWCLATLCAALFIALVFGAHWALGDTPALLVSYGTGLALSTIALVVFAGFKTYAELSSRPLVLIANEQQSMWSQPTQPSGETFTHMSLQFQATNLSDSAIKISGVSLRWPWVQKRHVLQSRIMVRHPTQEIYGSEYPIAAHSLTYGQAVIVITRAVGTKGKPRRIVVSIQDHARRRYRLVFPHVRHP